MSLERIAASLALALLASCGDVPERAGEPVDTAVLQDRRIAEGEVGRDSPAFDDTTGAADTVVAAPERTFVLVADSAAGFLLYHRKAGCIACHGADGEGLANLGPNLRDETWLHITGSLASIEDVIRTGIARPREAAIAMPGLASRLEPQEIQRVAAYVYALSHPGAAVMDTAAARRDTATAPPRDTTPPRSASPFPSR